MEIEIKIGVLFGDDVSPEEARIRAQDIAATMIDMARSYARAVHGAEMSFERKRDAPKGWDKVD